MIFPLRFGGGVRYVNEYVTLFNKYTLIEMLPRPSDDNNKDDNNDKGISALGLDRDLGFSRGHQGYQGHRPHDDDDD